MSKDERKKALNIANKIVENSTDKDVAMEKIKKDKEITNNAILGAVVPLAALILTKGFTNVNAHLNENGLSVETKRGGEKD